MVFPLIQIIVTFLVRAALTPFLDDVELFSEVGKGEAEGPVCLSDVKPTLIVGAEKVNPEILKVKRSLESVWVTLVTFVIPSALTTDTTALAESISLPQRHSANFRGRISE